MLSKLNWKDYCQEYEVIEVEVGFGNSCTIQRLASIQSEKLFIGIEILYHFYLRCLTNNKFENVILINADVRQEILNIPSNSISQFYFYFPSPVPISTRIFSTKFHNDVFRTLKKNGGVKIVTDDYEYYKEIDRLFSNNDWGYTSWQKLPYLEPDSSILIDTDCEKIYGSKYHIECYKK